MRTYTRQRTRPGSSNAQRCGHPGSECGNKRGTDRRRQNGAALITALLVMTLAAVLVAGLLWREQVEIRRVENQRQAQQARWVSRGGFDWTRLILRSEADSSPQTYLGGVWSVPIAETRLSDFIGKLGAAREDQGASTWLSGSIEDAQAKFNLRNLVSASGSGSDALSVDPVALAQFQKLLSLLGFNSQLAVSAAVQMRASLMFSATRVQHADTGNPASAAQAGVSGGGFGDTPGLADQDNNRGARPLPIHSLDALSDVPGFTPQIIARLRPFVTMLPVPSQINLNTAGPEVIAASIPSLPLSGAQGFISARDQAFIVDLAQAESQLSRFAPNIEGLDQARFDVTTRFFMVHGRVRHERAIVDRVALIYRDPRTHGTHIIEVRDAPSAD